jgi:hypothetical protein
VAVIADELPVIADSLPVIAGHCRAMLTAARIVLPGSCCRFPADFSPVYCLV